MCRGLRQPKWSKIGIRGEALAGPVSCEVAVLSNSIRVLESLSGYNLSLFESAHFANLDARLSFIASI